MTRSGAVETQPSGFPLAFFAITFLFSWAFWFLAWLIGKGRLPLPQSTELIFLIVGACGPLVSVFTLLFREGGGRAMLKFAKRSLQYRIGFVYLLPILFLFPALSFLAAYWHSRSGGPAAHLQGSLAEIPVAFVFLFFLGGSVEEEFGWAYAIDRLQEKWPVLPASIALGLIWGLWHLPLFFISFPGLIQNYIPFALFLLLTAAVRTIMYGPTIARTKAFSPRCFSIHR